MRRIGGNARCARLLALGVWLPLFWVLWAAPAAEVAAPIELKVQGRTFTFGRIDRCRTNVHWGRFVATAKESRWRIEYFDEGWSNTAPGGLLFKYVSYGDGTNTFTSGNPIGRVRDNRAGSGTFKSRADTREEDLSQWPGLAVVDRANVPRPVVGSMLDLGALWYAYCSAAYLNKANPDFLEPPYLVDGDLRFYQKGITNVPSILLRHSGPPHLAETVIFKHNGRMLDDNFHEIVLPKNLRGFTNAIFRAEAFTNVSGISVPLRARLSLYGVLPGGPAPYPAEPYAECLITAESVKSLEGESLITPVPARTSQFVDQRFASPSEPTMKVYYDSDRWLTEEEVRAMPAFKRAKESCMAPGSRARSGVSSGLLLLSALIAVPPIIYAVARSKKPQL